MKKCPNCGVENKPEAKFCKSCRHSFASSVIQPEVKVNPKPEIVTPKPVKKVQVSNNSNKPSALVMGVVFLVLAAFSVGVGFFLSSKKPIKVDEEAPILVKSEKAEPSQEVKVDKSEAKVQQNNGEKPVVLTESKPASVNSEPKVMPKQEAQVQTQAPVPNVVNSPSVNVQQPKDVSTSQAVSVNNQTVKAPKSTSASSSSAEANRQKLLELKRQLGQ